MGDNHGKWSRVDAKYSHKDTLSLGNYRDQPFVTGCSDRSMTSSIDDKLEECYQKTEFFDIWEGRWNDAPDYPFTSDQRSVKTRSKPGLEL